MEAAAPPKLAMSIGEFCHLHNISHAFFYLLQQRGEGPRVMKVGSRRLVSVEEAAAWRARRTVTSRGRCLKHLAQTALPGAAGPFRFHHRDARNERFGMEDVVRLDGRGGGIDILGHSRRTRHGNPPSRQAPYRRRYRNWPAPDRSPGRTTATFTRGLTGNLSGATAPRLISCVFMNCRSNPKQFRI
jgi:hypothetical protein